MIHHNMTSVPKANIHGVFTIEQYITIKTPHTLHHIANEMIPIYERLSDTNLLKRMQRGGTQTIFVGKDKLHGAVASAISAGGHTLDTGCQKIVYRTTSITKYIYKKTLTSKEYTSPKEHLKPTSK